MTTPITTADVLFVVRKYYRLRMADIVGPKRGFRRVARVRGIAMYLARKHTHSSYPELARQFRRGHSTVLAAVATVTSRLDDERTQAEVAALETLLGAKSRSLTVAA